MSAGLGRAFRIGPTGWGRNNAILEPFHGVAPYEEKPSLYSDWGDRNSSAIWAWECAGEIVSLFFNGASRAKLKHSEALVALDEGDYARADGLAYLAMLKAARALVRTQYLDLGDDPEHIVAEFKRRFYDTQLFFDKYASNKFAQYFFQRHENPLHHPTRPPNG